MHRRSGTNDCRSPCLSAPTIQESECQAKPSEAHCRPVGTSVPAPPEAPPSTLSGPGNKGTGVVEHERVEKHPTETRAQKLNKALKACNKKKNKKKRQACKRAAEKKYGSHVASRKSHKASRSKR